MTDHRQVTVTMDAKDAEAAAEALQQFAYSKPTPLVEPAIDALRTALQEDEGEASVSKEALDWAAANMPRESEEDEGEAAGFDCVDCGKPVGPDGHVRVEHRELGGGVASAEGQCADCLKADQTRNPERYGLPAHPHDQEAPQVSSGDGEFKPQPLITTCREVVAGWESGEHDAEMGLSILRAALVDPPPTLTDEERERGVEALRESLWSTWGARRQTTDWPSREQLGDAFDAALRTLAGKEQR